MSNSIGGASNVTQGAQVPGARSAAGELGGRIYAKLNADHPQLSDRQQDLCFSILCEANNKFEADRANGGQGTFVGHVLDICDQKAPQLQIKDRVAAFMQQRASFPAQASASTFDNQRLALINRPSLYPVQKGSIQEVVFQEFAEGLEEEIGVQEYNFCLDVLNRSVNLQQFYQQQGTPIDLSQCVQEVKDVLVQSHRMLPGADSLIDQLKLIAQSS